MTREKGEGKVSSRLSSASRCRFQTRLLRSLLNERTWLRDDEVIFTDDKPGCLNWML